MLFRLLFGFCLLCCFLVLYACIILVFFMTINDDDIWFCVNVIVYSALVLFLLYAC